MRSGLGRITVSQYGLYASVCADSWTDVETEVTCKMLGYRGQVSVLMIFLIRLKVNFLEMETYISVLFKRQFFLRKMNKILMYIYGKHILLWKHLQNVFTSILLEVKFHQSLLRRGCLRHKQKCPGRVCIIWQGHVFWERVVLFRLLLTWHGMQGVLCCECWSTLL